MNVLAFCAEEQDRNEWVIEKRKIVLSSLASMLSVWMRFCNFSPPLNLLSRPQFSSAFCRCMLTPCHRFRAPLKTGGMGARRWRRRNITFRDR